MKSKITLLVLFIIISGCSDNITDPEPKDHYKLWLSHGITNYTIDQMASCYCIGAGEIAKVTIAADTISSIKRIIDNSEIVFPDSRLYITIDSMFSIILNNKGDSLEVQYNSVYGYPERLDINPQQHPFDGGILYETFNLKVN